MAAANRKPASVGGWAYSFNRFPSAVSNAFIPIAISVCVALALITAVFGRTSTLQVPGIILAVALVLAALVRARRIGIWATPTQVIGKGFFRTYEFSWADVEELRVAQFQLYSAWKFKLRDGREIGVQCLPARDVFSETSRLAAASATPVKVDPGRTKPKDF